MALAVEPDSIDEAVRSWVASSTSVVSARVEKR
jgi:hypothetical protein